jgi:uncharacterized membrane protein YjgN (DUF898 family)
MMSESSDGGQVAGHAAESPSSNTIPFVFEGKGGEYFGIWITNVFLTVLTLGIYSAWAKVRNLRYFYRSTSLDGSHFDFHANPVAILKGRIIAVAFFILFAVISELSPIGSLVLLVILAGAVPWIIVRSLKFRFANTSYRNLRFGFEGRYSGAMKEYLLMPLLLLPSLGLLWPYIRYRQQRYIVSNARYGTTKAGFDGPWVPWFAAGLPLVLVAVLGFAIPGIYIAIKLQAALASGEATAEEIDGEVTINTDGMAADPFGEMAPIFALAVLAFYLALPYYIVRTRNLMFAASSVGAHHFESTMRTIKYIGIVLLSLFIIGITFGFGIPLAKVIMAKYKAETLALISAGDLDRFVAQEQEAVQALGDELGEAFDIDIDI